MKPKKPQPQSDAPASKDKAKLKKLVINKERTGSLTDEELGAVLGGRGTATCMGGDPRPATAFQCAPTQQCPTGIAC